MKKNYNIDYESLSEIIREFIGTYLVAAVIIASYLFILLN